MTNIQQAYQDLENDVAAWAQAQPDILAAIIVGSRARQDHPADEFSDLDFIFYVQQPQRYARQRAWLEGFGPALAVSLGMAGPDLEWLVLYASGVKADFVLSQAPDPGASLADLLANSPHGVVLERGVRLLFNKLPGAAELPGAPARPQPQPSPTEAEFHNAVDGFLVAASRAAKLLRRGDLWRAKMACDCELKQYLLQMLAWHALALYGAERDTWYDGRFIAEWADPDALQALPPAFGSYDQSDLQRALHATLQLYSRLGRSAAPRLGLDYPEKNEIQVWELIHAMAA